MEINFNLEWYWIEKFSTLDYLIDEMLLLHFQDMTWQNLKTLLYLKTAEDGHRLLTCHLMSIIFTQSSVKDPRSWAIAYTYSLTRCPSVSDPTPLTKRYWTKVWAGSGEASLSEMRPGRQATHVREGSRLLKDHCSCTVFDISHFYSRSRVPR